MIKALRILVGTVFIFFCNDIFAQETVEAVDKLQNNKIIVTVFGGRTIPINTFSEFVPVSDLGGGASFLFMADKDLPVYAGFSLSSFTYDSEILISALSIDDIFSVYQQQTKNNIFIGQVIISARPDFGWAVKPYAEGFFGTTNMNTRTELTDLNISDQPFDRYINLGTWSFNIGGTAGLTIPMSFTNNKVAMDIKCSYLKGTAVDYLVRIEDEIIIPEESIDVFEEKNSITDLILPQLGISITFGPRLMDAFKD